MDSDQAFRMARAGNVDAFAEWMAAVEIPLRRSVARLASAVDVEVVIQETFLRMWLIARDPQRPLEGEQAALRFACRVARNVALEEMRRYRTDRFVDIAALENLPAVEPDPPDPALRRVIRECIGRLPSKPASVLAARMRDGSRHDRDLAGALGMRLNTFLQNIVRARKLLRECLRQRGVRLEEILS